MKLSVVLLIIATLNVLAEDVYSQNKVFSLNYDITNIGTVLKEIEEQSEFYFLFNQELVDVNKQVSINMTNKKLDEILIYLFSGTDVAYAMFGKQVILSPRKYLTGFKLESQQLTISGKVTDVSENPLPGVNILEKGTTNGAVTNLDGEYTISIGSPNAILSFSYVGFLTEEIEVGGQEVINLIMIEDIQSLEEVVVVGYGVQKKVNVIGSIASISNEEIVSSPVGQVSNALAGRLPGAIIQQRSGEPGNDAADILIRGRSTLGDNSPLVIIDGIQGRDLNSVNANDVESISVLKDASAAIYGSRAANGVILITTKRGKNEAASINYHFYNGWVAPTRLLETADAGTYAQMIREWEEYNGYDESSMTYSLEDIEKYKSGEFPWTHPNTDWYKEVLKKYSNTNHHDLSVTGGNDKINYYVAFSAHSDDGIQKKSATSYNKYNLMANLDVKLNKYLTVGIDINGYKENRKEAGRNSEDVFANVFINPPTLPATYPNGLPGTGLVEGDNPVVTATDATGFEHLNTFRTNNKFSVDFKVPGIEGLNLSSYYAFDVAFDERKHFVKPWTLYSFDKDAYLAAGNTGKEDGSEFLISSDYGAPDPRLINNYSKDIAKIFNAKINYEKSINGIHNINAFIAYESSQFDGQGISAFRRYFLSDRLPYLFAGGDAEKNNDESVSLDGSANYFGRISYNYKETYLLQFSLRRDGSLRFSEEEGRWGNFPGFLAGWRISNEEFWKNNINFIDYLKLKASWAVMGNDLVPAFQYLAKYDLGTGMVMGDSRSYSFGLHLSSVPNPFITWETANVYNAGFESLLFNKLKFNTDFFYERRTNILVERNASVPDFTGLSLPDENYGIVESKGFEMELGYHGKNGQFTYNIDGNFSFARNAVVEFDEPEKNVSWQELTGHPQGSQLIYRSLGVFRDMEQVNSYPHVPGAGPGDIIIEDYDGDGEITADDRVLMEKTDIPEITYGVTFNLNYKNWSLSGLVQGVANTEMWIQYPFQGYGGNYFKFDTEDRWTPTNIDATNPRAFDRTVPYWRSAYTADWQYHNMAYARLKNLQLTYSLPENIYQSIGFKGAQVYISGQNLFLIYAGNDIVEPEMNVSTNNNIARVYPLMRVFALGVRISL